jgi:protocatechuate 3,4-dioxygenase, beta subunit
LPLWVHKLMHRVALLTGNRGRAKLAHETHIITRRSFAGAALAGAGLLVGGRALAAQEWTSPGPLGPFYPVVRPADDDYDMTMIKGNGSRAIGRVIEVSGRVLDMKGNPVPDATLELWQSNAAGRYAHAGDTSAAPLDPNFQGYAQLKTGASGEWRVMTIKPGAYADRTPHIHFDVRGKQNRLISQMYFAEDAATNSKDALYNRLGKFAHTATAKLEAPDRYRWDITLLDR